MMHIGTPIVLLPLSLSGCVEVGGENEHKAAEAGRTVMIQQNQRIMVSTTDLVSINNHFVH